MKWYPYGHDFGNAEIGGVTLLEQRAVSRSIPTAFATVDTRALRGLGIDIAMSLVLRFQTASYLRERAQYTQAESLCSLSRKQVVLSPLILISSANISLQNALTGSLYPFCCFKIKY